MARLGGRRLATMSPSPDRDHALLGRYCVGDLTEKAAGGARIRRCKLRVVEHIRTFHPQLEVHSLCDPEAFKQAHVPIVDCIAASKFAN
jgi:hypothetical protein